MNSDRNPFSTFPPARVTRRESDPNLDHLDWELSTQPFEPVREDDAGDECMSPSDRAAYEAWVERENVKYNAAQREHEKITEDF